MTSSGNTGTHDQSTRPTYRVPVGMPIRDEGRRAGAVVSFFVHLLIILLLGLPFVFSSKIIVPFEQGAGGAGPAGGGGGGRGGTSDGYHETLRFVRVVPGQVPTPTTIPPIAPPVVPKPTPQPVVIPPAQPVAKPPEEAAVPAPTQAVATTTGVGTGAGTGHDGTAGNGPGTGGGVGSGNGPGRGSGNGPGTGGGNQANYPPLPIEFFLPPLPPPSSVRGFHFIAEFDVDSTGRVLDVQFSPTRDGDYNRRISSILHSMRFRPGTRPDGTPLRMKAQVGYDF